ncbi:MAG: hypothetical protein ACOC2H_08115 [Spirochaetota bacterium]
MKKTAVLLLFVLIPFLYACEIIESDDTTDDSPVAENGDGSIDDEDVPEYDTEDGDGYYPIEDFSLLTGMTEAQLREHYEQNYGNSSSYDEAVTGFNIEAREPGTMTQAGLDDFRRRTNFFRSFYQLPPVGDPDSGINEKCQEAALSMIVENNISHYPLNDGFTYANETAQEAASQSNLAIAWSSSSFDYTQLLDNLVMDIGVPSTGHRRWFLLPGQKGAGYGYLYNTNAPTYGNADVLIQWVFDYDIDTEYDLPVPYPPAGAYPLEFTVGSNSRLVDFSLYWYGASFTGCTVSMTDQDGDTIPLEITHKEAHSQSDFPPAALIWTPDTLPAAGDEWTVEISGITGKDTSSLSYTITFIDLGVSRTPGSSRRILR